MKELLKNRIKTSACIMCFPIIMFLLLGPVEIYYSNINEFYFTFKNFGFIFIGIAIALFVVGTLILSILPKLLYGVSASLIFAFSLMSYVQNMLLNKNIVKEDGTPVDWATFSRYTRMNTVIWVAVIISVLAIYFIKKSSIKIFGIISLFFGAFQMITYLVVVANCVMAPSSDIDNHYVFSGRDQLSFGKENIIVLLLDHYSNTDFENELYNVNSQGVESVMHDFTYYNNADSHYNFTFPSMPAMLTGEAPNVDMKFAEWLDYAWSSEKCTNFYNQLHEAGYKCVIFSGSDAYAVLGNIKNLDGKFDNIISDKPIINYGLMCRLLEKETVYRYSPYAVKPRFEMRSNAFKDTYVYQNEDTVLAYENSKYMDRLKDEGVKVDEGVDKLFTFTHLQGMHGPYITGTKGELVDETTSDITIQGLHCIVEEYLNQLKDSGVYDNSTIIIMADHGGGVGDLAPQPIFFVKLPNEHHDNMQINSAPISYDDFQATILDMAGLDYEGYGTTIFDWDSDDIRKRELWYPVDGFNVYEYSGNRDDIIKKIKDEDYKHINTELRDKWRGGN